jgi:hypothetical protein
MRPALVLLTLAVVLVLRRGRKPMQRLDWTRDTQARFANRAH